MWAFFGDGRVELKILDAENGGDGDGLCAVCEECRCTVECGLVAIQHASIKPLV